MRTADMIKSNFIRTVEVKAAGAMVLSIVACTLEKVGTDEKWVLWFNEHPKGLSLNNTKIRLLEAAYGDDSDHWIGRRVRLTFDPTVMMAGQVVGGIKLTCSTLQQPPNGRPFPGAQAPAAHGLLPPGAPPPPQPVWDGTRWIFPQTAPAPQPEFDKGTGEIYHPQQSARPQTISERVNQNHPPADYANFPPPGSPAEFDDDIPF